MSANREYRAKKHSTVKTLKHQSAKFVKAKRKRARLHTVTGKRGKSVMSIKTKTV